MKNRTAIMLAAASALTTFVLFHSPAPEPAPAPAPQRVAPPQLPKGVRDQLMEQLHKPLPQIEVAG